MAKLGEILVRQGVLTEEQLARALEAQVIYGGRLGTNLVEMGMVTEEQIAQCLGHQFSTPCALADVVATIPADVIACVPRAVAERYRVIPLARNGRTLELGMADPRNLSRIDEISFQLNTRVQPYVLTELTVNYALERYYGVQRQLRYVRVLGTDTSGEMPAFNPDAHPPPRQSDSIALTEEPPPAETKAVRGNDLVKDLAEVMSMGDLLDVTFRYLTGLFAEAMILVPKDEVAHVVLVGNRNAARPNATMLHAACRDGTLLGEAIKKAHLLYKLETSDSGFVQMCKLAGIRPSRLALLPISDGRGVRLIAVGQGRDQSEVMARSEEFKTFLGRATCALQILDLRREILRTRGP